MKHNIFSAAAYAIIGLSVLSAPAFAATPAKPAPSTSLKDLKLPSQAEIDDMLENLPDFNAIMGDMIDMAKDEKMQKRFETTAESFKDLLDEDVLSKRDKNGLPDMNALLATMLGAMSEDGPAGELLGGVAEIASEMETIMEKHAVKP